MARNPKMFYQENESFTMCNKYSIRSRNILGAQAQDSPSNVEIIKSGAFIKFLDYLISLFAHIKIKGSFQIHICTVKEIIHISSSYSTETKRKSIYRRKRKNICTRRWHQN